MPKISLTLSHDALAPHVLSSIAVATLWAKAGAVFAKKEEDVWWLRFGKTDLSMQLCRWFPSEFPGRLKKQLKALNTILCKVQ